MSDRRSFAKAFLLAAICFGHASAQSTLPSNAPNIVFILMDDMGWRDIGSAGSTFYETPHIDALAAQGTRFTKAYAASHVCSPTRSAIMTGKYPARTKNTNYFGAGAASGKLTTAPYVNQLELAETTLAETLGKAGYKTGFIGKWHLGGGKYLPEFQGFASNIAGSDAGHPNSYFSPYKNDKLPDGPAGEYLTDRLTDEAIGFITANKSVPFFLYLCEYAVHTPIQAKADLIRKYQQKAAKLDSSTPEFGMEGTRQLRLVQRNAAYAAMIESVDQGVGRILARLQSLGLEENTLVIFSSDNGGLAVSQGTPTANSPLRAGKGYLYEGGLRIPLIVKWPKQIAAARETSAPVTLTDIYPTLLNAIGLPLLPQQHVDGVSFWDVLRNGSVPKNRPLFWHYPHYSDQGGTPGSAMLSGRYKLIESFEDNSLELYDLVADPGEKANLAKTQPARTLQMRDTLWAWRKSLNANMPPDYAPPVGLFQRPTSNRNPLKGPGHRDLAGRKRATAFQPAIWRD